MKTASRESDFVELMSRTEGFISLDEAKLLYELAKTIKDDCIVEVGSYRGRSTVALGLGSLHGQQVPVFAIEPHEEFTGVLGGAFGPADRAMFYKAMLDTSCYLTVRLVNLSSEVVAPNWNKSIGLLWIDGDHRYEAVKRDFDCWLPHLSPDALVAFDDSLNPRIGPQQLIKELFSTRNWGKVLQVGKVTVISRI